MIIFWMLLAAYVVLSVASALVWGKFAWRTERITSAMNLHGYDHALDKVQRDKMNLMVGWPIVIPCAALVACVERVLAASDPHRQHQREYEKSMASYIELSDLERQAGMKLSVDVPERWCPCLYEEDERDPHEAEIQRRVEIELSRQKLELGPDSRMHTNLDEIKTRLVRLGMWR